MQDSDGSGLLNQQEKVRGRVVELADTQDLGSCGASCAGSSPASPTNTCYRSGLQISQAVILAAGFGERLRPLTAQTPKPLLPLWGEPVIGRTIRALEAIGVERIAVNLHWGSSLLESYLRSWRGSAEITLAPEAEILGTGGALVPLTGWLGKAPFWLVNGDIAWWADLSPLAAALQQKGRIAAAWLMPRRGPQTVGYNSRGDITTFRSSVAGSPGTATFCGVQAVWPEISNYFPEKKMFSIVEAYQQAQQAGLAVAGVRLAQAYWRDIGTLEGYLQAHGEVKQFARRGDAAGALYDMSLDGHSLTSSKFSCGGSDSAMSVVNSVILPGGGVESGVRVRDSIVGKNARVRAKLNNAIAVAASECGDAAVVQAVEALGWDRESAVIFLGKRGSARRFWRVQPNHAGESGAIVVAYSRERSENGRYAGHAALLAEAGVPVPRVLADLPDNDIIVLEDWGDSSLQQRMMRANANVLKLYRPVMVAAATFHMEVAALVQQSKRELEPAFDGAIYRWERELFERHMVVERYRGKGLERAVRREMELVAERLLTARQVVVHRDFQSSNILMRGDKIVVIDFQGMRFGSGAYDIASLLYDPYVKLSTTVRSQLLDEYVAFGGGALDEVTTLLPWAAVQRLTHALGAYGRLSGMGLPFAGYIPAAATLWREQAEVCGLSAIADLATQILDFEASS